MAYCSAGLGVEKRGEPSHSHRHVQTHRHTDTRTSMLTSAISKKNNSGKPRKEACEKEEKESEYDPLMEELLEKDPMKYLLLIKDQEKMKNTYIPNENQCKFEDCRQYGFSYIDGANFCLACTRQQNSAWLVSESEWIAKNSSYECLEDGYYHGC